MEEYVLQPKNNRKKIILIAVLAVVVVAASVTVALVLILNSPARRLQRQIDLGNRYLSELQYDEAIAAYEAALRIDPKSALAYGGLISAHVGDGNLQGAVSSYGRGAAQLSASETEMLSGVLTQAVEHKAEQYLSEEAYTEARELLIAAEEAAVSDTMSRELKQYRKEKEDIISDALKQDVDTRTLPGDVTSFLSTFAWSTTAFRNDYTCDREYPATDSPLTELLNAIPCVPVWEYSVWNEERWLTDVDPLALVNPDGSFMYAIFDGDGVDWVLENVLNCTQEAIENMRKEVIPHGDTDDRAYLYYHDGDYYRADGGVGGPSYYRVSIMRAQYDGMYYFLDYRLEFGMWDYTGGYDPDARDDGYFEAKMAWKTDGDFSYWSLYENHQIEYEDIYDAEKLSAAEEAAFFAALPEFIFASGVGAWSTQVVIAPDGTFEGYFHDWDMGVYMLYQCNFSGRFADVTRLTDHIYQMKLVELHQEEEDGKEETFTMDNDPQLYTLIWTTPYGMENGETFMVYLPGTDINILPDGFVSWVSMPMGWGYEQPEVMPFYGMYNVEAEYGFFGSE